MKTIVKVNPVRFFNVNIKFRGARAIDIEVIPYKSHENKFVRLDVSIIVIF